MKKTLLISGLLIGMFVAANAVTVSYTADNTTIFTNPERGFTEEQSGKVSETNTHIIKGKINENWGKAYNMTVMVVLYNLKFLKDKDIPSTVLEGFDEDMQELRNQGLKCVLRFAYSETQTDNVDATPEWVKRHLEQLKPHLAKNADVIYVLEAGFVGVWGEWYYTANYGNESQHMNDKRRQVIEYLFQNVPEDRFVLFRYPMIKTEYLGDETPLSANEAFTGTIRARMGCHNDAFLNNWGNDGTYASNSSNDDPAVRQYVATETLYVPNGGETNVESNSLAEQVYTKAPEEMARYHWSFCGKSYATQVTGRWRESGLFDTLNVHMGYRYNLVDAQFTDEAAPSGKMNVTIRLKNTGYAPIYNERKAYIVLRDVSNQQSVFSIPLSADPRRWLTNKRMSAINEQITIPADVPEGKYHLYLHLPDKYASIAADPRYAVRFANKDVWDGQTGMNDLKAEVVISKEASSDPGELPEVDIEAVPEVANPQEASARKIIEEGILYIQRDGHTYSVTGTRVN